MTNDVAQGKMANRLSSPEELNDYLKVTSPRVWVLLAAVTLLIAGLLVWSNLAVVESFATGTAIASGGNLAVTFDNAAQAKRVEPGMTLTVGDVEAEVLTVGTDSEGNIVASSRANIPDGAYDIRVGYDTTSVISMLLN